MPNDYEKELKGNPVCCSCQSYDSTRDINDNNVVLFNAVVLNMKDKDTCEISVNGDLESRTSQRALNRTTNEHYTSQRSSECRTLTEQTLKTKWWAGCFPWLAK